MRRMVEYIAWHNSVWINEDILHTRVIEPPVFKRQSLIVFHQFLIDLIALFHVQSLPNFSWIYVSDVFSMDVRPWFLALLNIDRSLDFLLHLPNRIQPANFQGKQCDDRRNFLQRESRFVSFSFSFSLFFLYSFASSMEIDEKPAACRD